MGLAELFTPKERDYTGNLLIVTKTSRGVTANYNENEIYKLDNAHKSLIESFIGEINKCLKKK